MSAAFVTRLKMASTAFWFLRLNRLPRGLCSCSKTKSCVTRWEKEAVTSCAKNFCCHATSSSTSISSASSGNEWRAELCDVNGAGLLRVYRGLITLLSADEPAETQQQDKVSSFSSSDRDHVRYSHLSLPRLGQARSDGRGTTSGRLALAPCWRIRLWCCRNPGCDPMAASSPYSGLPAPLAASNVDLLYRGFFHALYSWPHRWRCDADPLSRCCRAGCKIPLASQALFSTASGRYNRRDSRCSSLLSR